MSLFKKYTQIDYTQRIANFNPENMTQEYSKIIDGYKTPSREYIKKSARGLSASEVDLEILDYIICQCRECSEKQRYEAAIVALFKLHNEHHASKEEVDSSKAELLKYFSTEGALVIEDWSFLDSIILDYNPSFFYILKIIIGNNTIYKYGITRSTPRKRFSQIKVDISAAYKNQYVQITPILLLYIQELESFEENVKISLLEFNINYSNYAFKGSTETFCKRHKKMATEEIILPKAAKLKAIVLYDEDNIANANNENMIGFPYHNLSIN